MINPVTAALGLALLVLLPGLLVVRAPWTAVPALSLAFWALSPWWSPAWLSRSGLADAATLVFLLLLALRLWPKHEVPPPADWPAPARPPDIRAQASAPRFAVAPSLLIAAVAVALLAPAPAWRNPPGPRLAFQATAARLVLWRDGVPLSSEPLLPIRSFGAHAPAIATLSADVARRCALPPPRAVTVVLLLGAALALVGLFWLCAAHLAPATAALAALTAVATAALPLALVPPGSLDGWGVGEAVVALGFLLPASALIVGHGSRSAAVAAAWLCGAGALVQPVLALAMLAASAPFASRRRVAAVGLGAFGLAAPGLAPLASALSPHEAGQLARPLAEGLAAAVALLAAAALAAGGSVLWARGSPSRRWTTALAAAPALVLVGALHAWLARAQLPPAAWVALSRIEETTGALEVACVGREWRDWVPAVAARAIREPGSWTPVVYVEEWESLPYGACAGGK